MNPTAMQDDLDGAWYVINDNAPAQKDYISCYFCWDIIVGSGCPRIHIFDYIKYGKVICIEQ